MSFKIEIHKSKDQLIRNQKTETSSNKYTKKNDTTFFTLTQRKTIRKL